MRALKRISDYIPKTNEAVRLVQAKVEEDLYTEFNALRKAEKISWKSFIVAAMRKFIDEKKAK